MQIGSVFEQSAEDLSPELARERAEEEKLARVKTAIEVQRLEEITKKNARRYRYAAWFLWIAGSFMIIVVTMIACSGCETNGFKISDTVLVALLGTALSTVAAPTILLARYLFTNTNGRVSDRTGAE
ncbi:MAG: hypothetical protein OXM02_04525 [Bacteroidota bacterium]|nr:hypothetical protein [Bacteroidota bacterium]